MMQPLLAVGFSDPRFDSLEPYHLNALEREQMVKLYDTKDGLPLLDRIFGVFATNPLALEAEQFGELQCILIHQHQAPDLAARLVREVRQMGGLLPRAEALRRYEAYSGSDSSTNRSHSQLRPERRIP